MVIAKRLMVAVASTSVVGLSVLGLGACSSSAKGAAPTTSSTTKAASGTTVQTPTGGSEITENGDARITTFVVPAKVQCGSGTQTTVSVRYALTDATRQQIAVDGRNVDGVDEASGTVSAPVHCDGVPHTVALVAFDAKGARTSQVKLLNTLLPGS